MQICELIFEEEAVSYCKNPNETIDNISTDIFNLKPQFLYVAQRRRSFDIQKIAVALEKRCDGIVLCDTALNINFPKEKIIRVKNVRRAAAFIYARFYRICFEKMTFIGITGTNGKSTTAQITAHLLKESGKSVGFIGTGKIDINGTAINEPFYSMTTPDVDLLYKSIKAMEECGCEYVVMEVSSHALFFEKTAPIPFRIGIFTNMSLEHSDFHSSMKEYFLCKYKLFEASQIGIFNSDDEYSKQAYQLFNGEKYSVAVFGNGDSQSKDLNLLSLSNTEYVYREKELIFKVEIGLGGIYNVYNSLFAIKAALLLGIDTSRIKSALKSLNFIEGRNEIISENPTVIIDYAHTPAAIENELFFLKSKLNSEQKLITVFGCGGERDREKRSVMASIAEKFSDFLIISSDNARGEDKAQIFRDIIKGIKKKDRCKVITSRKEAIIYAINTAGRNDVVAIIGKGHERYNIDKNGKHYFDERAIVKDELERLGYSYEN